MHGMMKQGMMKECMKPHALMHSLAGLGLGLVIARWLGGAAMVLGVIAIVVGILGDTMAQKSKNGTSASPPSAPMQ